MGSIRGDKKVAHFLRIPELVRMPQTEALISAYLDLGYGVDFFVPGGRCDVSSFGDRVTYKPVEYGRRWLLRNALLPVWRRYSLFSGTSEDPLAAVGLLSILHRRPAIAWVDEIASGSYRGERSKSWKRLCRLAMRRAELNIVNDASRIDLLKEYAQLAEDKKIFVYPNAFREPPPPVNRKLQRDAWGIPEDGLVLGASGNFTDGLGADWMIDALRFPGRYGVIQGIKPDFNSFALFLLKRLEVSSRIYVQEWIVDQRTIWSQAAAMDVGIAIYKYPAAQFQRMGTSSNRLCMFLAMGVPVIASRQDSFHFLEKYNCGILVDNGRDFSAAVDTIRDRLVEMRMNALRCYNEYIKPSERYVQLREAVAGVLGDSKRSSQTH
jgi:hypothetical protein